MTESLPCMVSVGGAPIRKSYMKDGVPEIRHSVHSRRVRRSWRASVILGTEAWLAEDADFPIFLWCFFVSLQERLLEGG